MDVWEITSRKKTLQPDLAVKSGLLHSYCYGILSSNAANLCLLFYDWYVQRINKTKESEGKI